MARPILYQTDPDQLLRRIFELTHGRKAELQRQMDELRHTYDRDTCSTIQQLHQEKLRCDWLVYRAEELVDGPVSDGYRRAITREVLRLEQDGSIRGDGKRLAYVQLTEAGVERVEALAKKEAAE